MAKIHSDLTIIFYSANQNSDYFMSNVLNQLYKAVGETPIISVTFKPMNLGTNICIGEQKRSNYMLYKQVLIGAREAKTKYVAMAEDDMLYSSEHFEYRPGYTLAYDLNKWSLFSWTKPPIFSYRPRKLMNSLIAPRDLLVQTLEERFAKYPVLEEIPYPIFEYYWGEPGRFENHLKISKPKSETYMSTVPSIMFSTSEALGYQVLGKRKAHSKVKITNLEPWGTASQVLSLYEL